MNSIFKKVTTLWQTNSIGERPEAIYEFEQAIGITIPAEYKKVLIQFGRISNKNNSSYYLGENENQFDILMDGTFSLSQILLFKDTRWNEIINTNPNITEKTYLPVFNTYTDSCFFLIGLESNNLGKIFRYDDNFSDYIPLYVAESLSEFINQRTHQYKKPS